jgi:hypothetical protein
LRFDDLRVVDDPRRGGEALEERRKFGCAGLAVSTRTSAETSARASFTVASASRSVNDRTLTIAATPIAMQPKKTSRRRHDPRISRRAMFRMNFMAGRRRS